MRPEARQHTDRLYPVPTPRDRRTRADHWVYLDRTWAQRLGVKRAAGAYRIRGRELHRRLLRELLEANTPAQVGTVPPEQIRLHDRLKPQAIRRSA